MGQQATKGYLLLVKQMLIIKIVSYREKNSLMLISLKRGRYNVNQRFVAIKGKWAVSTYLLHGASEGTPIGFLSR